MFKSLSILALSAAMMTSTAVLAQETAETTEEAAQTEAAAEDAAGDTNEVGGLSMGREVQENPMYVKEEHGDWQLRCIRSQAEKQDTDPCHMFQLLREEQGNPVAEFTVFKLPEGAPAVAGATITVPLMTLLTNEVKLTVDGGQAKSYPFRFCNPVGCVAQIGFTQDDINAFKKGAGALVTITPAAAPDQNVPIKASLKGFTAAYDLVSVVAN